MSRESRVNYFSEVTGEEAFDQSFKKLLKSIHKKTFSKYLKPENTQTFKHGREWAYPAAPDIESGDLKLHSAQTEVSYEKLVNHDLSVVENVIQQLVGDMEKQFVQMMYSTVSAAAESVGNTVDAKVVGSAREAFAQTLEKIQFSANKFGEVQLPEIHLGSEIATVLEKSITAAPPDFHVRIEEIKSRKTAEAIQREVERKARFVRYGDSK